MGETESSKANENVNVKESVKKFMQDDVLKLQAPSMTPSIYRVPKELRNGHAKFFDPVSIPIGPLHYDEKSPAQELKKWCLKNFIGRFGQDEARLDKLAECMSDLESQIRQCYSDIDTEMTDENLVKIMLLDGCFIMELFWEQGRTSGTVFDSVPFLTLQQDLLKIENQLPFFVLKHLANLAREEFEKSNKPGSNKGDDYDNQDRSLIELALNFFNISKPAKDHAVRTPAHLLELVMNALFPDSTHSIPVTMPEDYGNSLIGAKSASELEFYGINFRAGDSGNVADVKFSDKGELKMPQLNIQEPTLWNLLIFEMWSGRKRILSSYIVLMGTLINNEKDVEVLLGSKILVSHGHDTKSLVSRFTELSATVNKKNFCFGQEMKRLNDYCESGYRPLRARLVRRCYDSRWELLNNVLLFILTFTQTLFSVLGYKPKAV